MIRSELELPPAVSQMADPRGTAAKPTAILCQSIVRHPQGQQVCLANSLVAGKVDATNEESDWLGRLDSMTDGGLQRVLAASLARWGNGWSGKTLSDARHT